MDELLFNKEYHITYLIGTKFEQRLFDAYIGLGTKRRPPFMEDMITEATQMQALLLLESARNEPWKLQLDERRWNNLHEAVWNDEDAAMLHVLSRLSDEEVENIVHDVMYFLRKYNLSTLVHQRGSKESVAFLYNPFQEVW